MTVVTETMQVQSHSDPPQVERDERRWDLWAWLTLIAGFLLILIPLLTSLAGMRYPGDGWGSTSVGAFGLTGPYRMLDNNTGKPSLLQPEDVVTAIDGRSLTADSLPPVPVDAEVGQTLHYTIERDGRTLEVDVPVVRLEPAAIFRSIFREYRDNPGNAIFAIFLFTLAMVVFFLRPGNLAARYLFLFAMFGQSLNLSMYNGLFRDTYPAWQNFLWQTVGWGWVYLFIPAIILIVLVFPIRKWPVRRFPRLTPLLFMGLPFLITIAANVAVWFGGIFQAAELLLPLTIYAMGLALITIPTTLIHNLLTIRDPLPRAQMRWIALGFGVGFLLPMTFLMVNFAVFGGIDWVTRLGNVALLFFPTCLAIGILRYRLFDIDVIIRRTTQYVVVTGILLLVFFGLVVVLQYLFSRVTGQSSTPAVVLSTLAIAALFNPVRRRVQDIIDRRFFRQKYDAEKTIEAFAATVRNETELDALTAELLRVIQETMQPATLSIWLRDPAVEIAQLQHSTRLENEG
jgi:hypothetical protein